MQIAQHQPSNNRAFTDDFLVECQNGFTHANNREEISSRKAAQGYIEVFDSELEIIRESYGNSITIGDAMSLALLERHNSYQGIDDPNSKGFNSGVGKSVGGVQGGADESAKEHAREVIETAFYDFDKRSTVYFLKVV